MRRATTLVRTISTTMHDAPFHPIADVCETFAERVRAQALQEALAATCSMSEALQDLASHGHWQELAIHSSVAHALSSRHVHLLTAGEGWLRHYGRQGADFIVAEVAVGQWWGGLGMGTPSTQCVRLDCQTACTLVTWEMDVLEVLWRSHPSLQYSYAESAAKWVGSTMEHLIGLGTMNVRGRLLNRLKKLSETAGVTNNQAWLPHPPSQSGLAAMLGCSREEVSREMSRLARAGWLLRQGRGWQVLDVAALSAEL